MSKPVPERIIFESWEAWLRAVQGDSEMMKENRSSRSVNRGASWDLGAEWREALKLANSGWSEGRKLVGAVGEEYARRLKGRGGNRFRPRYETDGGQVDVPLFLSGEPECMSVPRRQPSGPGRVVTMRVSSGFSQSWEAASIARRGAAIVALVDCLEAAGRRAEVWFEFGLYAKHDHSAGARMRVEVCIKRAGEALNLDLMGFALAHPVCFRRLGFSYMELREANWREAFGVGVNYGTCLSESEDLEQMAGADVAIPCGVGNQSKFESDEAALAWVREQLDRQAAGEGVAP